jgi:hypothetical protein
MSKTIVFALLFALALSVTITQEASALTKGSGYYNRSTASLDPSKVCGNRICEPGQNSKWSHAVLASQREGAWKATGGQYGDILMHQLVVNSLAKTSHTNSAVITSHTTITRSK